MSIFNTICMMYVYVYCIGGLNKRVVLVSSLSILDIYMFLISLLVPRPRGECLISPKVKMSNPYINQNKEPLL